MPPITRNYQILYKLVFGHQTREDGTDACIPFLALTLKGEFIRCSIREQRSILLASHGDVDVETAAVLEADGGCITIAETFKFKGTFSKPRYPTDMVVVLYLVVKDKLTDCFCDGGITCNMGWASVSAFRDFSFGSVCFIRSYARS